ncbi:MAG: type II toxin-antitoxin system PemK/MazF family toxin [Gemmataceae bacterium]
MPQPERGRIVWVELPDPQGRNPRRRPVVILTSNEEIQSGESLVGVAISTTFDPSHSEEQVELPWHRAGHPRTGLNKRCAAQCKWLIEFEESSIEEYGGVVPGKKGGASDLPRPRIDSLVFGEILSDIPFLSSLSGR